MSFCPLIKEKCKRDECSFWVKEAKIEGGVRCAFRLWFAPPIEHFPIEFSLEEDAFLRRKERDKKRRKSSQS